MNFIIPRIEKDEQVEQKAKGFAGLKEMEKRTKRYAEELRNDLLGAEVGVFGGDGFSVEVRNVEKKRVNGDVLTKICRAKNVEIGKKAFLIHPKNSNIPPEVLEILDKHFALEEQLLVDEADVALARDQGLITEKDYSKIVSIDKSKAIYSSVDPEYFDREYVV